MIRIFDPMGAIDKFIKRFFFGKAEEVSKPNGQTGSSRSDPVDEVGQWIANEVRAGFRTAEEINESALDVFGDEYEPEVIRALTRRLTSQAIHEHAVAQATWIKPTDNDLFDDACRDLEASGIFCRQNFSCCGTCGVAEIQIEMDEAVAKGVRVRGYLFYHEQDTESAVEGGGVYLNYGAFEGNDEASIAIGEEIRSAFMIHGLKVVWNGSLNTRIHVDLDWKRRRWIIYPDAPAMREPRKG
jgi:hypothetical protein